MVSLDWMKRHEQAEENIMASHTIQFVHLENIRRNEDDRHPPSVEKEKHIQIRFSNVS